MIVDSVASCFALAVSMSMSCALIIAVMVMAASVVAGLIVAPPYGTDEQHSQPIQNGSGVLAVSCWLGFEFNSTLGYPGEGPPVGTDAPLEMEVWLQQVEEQKRLIEALPVVKRLDFFYDDADQNLNKVEATLWCCWGGSQFKRIKEACDKGAKLTHLEAANVLRNNIIEKHACAGHVFNPRAVSRRAAIEADAEATPDTATAFNRIGLAQARQQGAARRATAAEQAVEASREVERAACLARDEAELQAKVLRAAADALKPKEPSHKKQKTAFSAGSSLLPAQQTDVCEPALGDDEEPTYTTWTPAKWKELETKEQQRRNKLIDPARTHA